MIDWVMWFLFMTFVYTPLTLGVLTDRLALVGHEWFGIREALCVSVYFVVATAVFFVTNKVLAKARDLSMDGGIALALFVLVGLFLATRTYCWTRRPFWGSAATGGAFELRQLSCTAAAIAEPGTVDFDTMPSEEGFAQNPSVQWPPPTTIGMESLRDAAGATVPSGSLEGSGETGSTQDMHSSTIVKP